MTGFRLVALLTAAALVLAACGDDPQTGEGWRYVGDRIGARASGSQTAEAPDAALLIDRSFLSGATDPIIRARSTRTNAAAVLVSYSDSNGLLSFKSQDNTRLALRDGVLASSSGLPGDLMASDTAMTGAALRGGAKQDLRRAHRYLDGGTQMTTVEFTCQMSDLGTKRIEVLDRAHSTRHFKEVCQGEDNTFENEYWVGTSDRIVWLSRQWLSPEIGHVLIERLIR